MPHGSTRTFARSRTRARSFSFTWLWPSSHDHTPKIDNLNTAFIIGIILNSAFVIIEVIAGLSIHSLSLLTDAGHNLSDVAGLALALLAFKLTKVSSNNKYTYGYKRSTIIVSFFNAVILFASVGIIVYEAVIRFMHPAVISGSTMAWVALIGIGINAFTAWLFVKGKDKDLNVKGTYLHMAMDAIVSFGVVISGVIIYFTHWYPLDSIVSYNYCHSDTAWHLELAKRQPAAGNGRRA